MACESAGENDKKGQCKKRNVVYETYCLLCEEREENKSKEIELYIGKNEKESMDNRENERKRKRTNENENKGVKKEVKKKKHENKEFKVKYIGETGRSGYERGLEHVRDFENCEETSHLLKHYLIFHRDVKKSDMKFGMRLRKSYRFPIERQVGEAIAIDRESRKGTILMNSKSEYNRCQIARITTLSKSESKKEIEKENEEERRYKEEIKEMKKKKREKKIADGEKMPKNKRRKCTENEVIARLEKMSKNCLENRPILSQESCQKQTPLVAGGKVSPQVLEKSKFA